LFGILISNIENGRFNNTFRIKKPNNEMDFSNLKSFINEKLSISEDEFEKIKPVVYLKNFKKNEVILQQGETCHFIGYLNKGLIRSYYYDDDKEITTQFYFENCLFTYVEGFMENSPSNKTFVALEDCEAIMMKKSGLWQIMESSAKFEKIFTLIIMEDLKRIMRDSEEKRKETPQERYMKFQRQFPTAFNRISLKYIATYLGIEPQSLSRIRKRMSEES
jgi:CRP/FNR family transcriptional regulator, anaerobic regulatory protein